MSATLSGVTPGLDAGATGRRLRKFRPTRSHINTLIANSGPTVLARARYLVRNNPYASNGCEYYAAQLVGDGITPAWRGPDPARKKALASAWLAWTDECDAEGLTDFYGLQRRAARELFIAGEVFFRKRMRRPEDGLAIPFQLQMLPSEMLPVEDNRVAPNGNVVRSGIEFDRINRRVAYHFYRNHPDDPMATGWGSREQVRVPADQVMHVMDPVESGQVRGLSMLAPAIVKLWLLDLYDDAELDRKRTAALFSVFRTRPSGDDDMGAEDQGDGTGVQELSPGAQIIGDPGEEVQIIAPADVGGNYEAFQYRNLVAAAAACGLPYVGLTGDMLKANYGNIRAALMDFRRRASAAQNAILIHQMCRPIGVEWLRQAVVAGAIPGMTATQFLAERTDYLPIPWSPPRWEWIDPQKDIKADDLEVAAGLDSRSAKIRARGLDPETVDRERAEEQARERTLGIVSGRGAASTADPTDPAEPQEAMPA